MNTNKVKAYLVLHIDEIKERIIGAGIYSEFPLSKLATDHREDKCIFYTEGSDYHEAVQVMFANIEVMSKRPLIGMNKFELVKECVHQKISVILTPKIR